ncbi:hypothetical protein I553_4500 [Mycobacterium xenopi 4042]|uniref:Uncharacterized protein n=1 Tax=Mycobacterium xenopi 4042 TaxID=1299334 RepID=X8AGU1_MYCXE|nr:hypothetical protein I553_4500 [Mycobacterium xenopi 4042]
MIDLEQHRLVGLHDQRPVAHGPDYPDSADISAPLLIARRRRRRAPRT